ncbi:MAG: hypothetical protein ABIO40_00065 [Devosia sp.]
MTRSIIDALVAELSEQGQRGGPRQNGDWLTAYPIKGTIDVVALAEVAGNALVAAAADEESKSPAELNAANDG